MAALDFSGLLSRFVPFIQFMGLVRFLFLIYESSLHIKEIIFLFVTWVASYTVLLLFFISDEDRDSEHPNNNNRKTLQEASGEGGKRS